MGTLLLIVLFGFTLCAVFTAGQALALRACGIRASEVGLGVGPTLASFRLGLTTVVLKPIPLATYLAVAPPEPSEEGGTPEAALVENFEAYEGLGRLKLVLIEFAGVAPLALLALVLLGPGAGGESILRGIPQLLEGAWSPKAVGAGLIRACLELPERQGLLTLAGVLAAKLTAMHLLPLASSSLGRQLLGLFGPPRHPLGPARLYAGFAISLISFAFGVCWLIALVSARG